MPPNAPYPQPTSTRGALTGTVRMSDLKKPVSGWVWALILAVCLSPCLCCGLLVAVGSALGSDSIAATPQTTSPAADNSTVASSVAAAPTDAPTDTPAPQPTDTPTPTPVPPTPTPTDSPVDTIRFAILDHTPGYCALVDQDVTDGEVTITYRLDGGYSPAEVSEDARTCIFDTMQLAYHEDFPVSKVAVTFYGPQTDQYGNSSVVQWATATLSAATAKKFNWNYLDPDRAWGDYDQQWMHS